MCLLIGMTGVGKTMLLKRLQNYTSKGSFTDAEDNPPTIPTVGTNLMNVTIGRKTEVTIRELGGAMAPIWSSYFSDCSVLIFMIDASCPTQISASCIQLLNTLTSDKMQKVNVLILLNKVDLPLSMPLGELRYLLRLEDVVSTAPQPITVLEISAKDGQGLSEANCDLIVKHEDDREDDNSSQSSFRDVIECWCEEGQSKQDQTARKYTT